MKYYVTTFPGISQVTRLEISDKNPSAKIVNQFRIENNDILTLDGIFPKDLTQLRTVEDFFFNLGIIHLDGNKSDLVSVSEFLSKNNMIDPALSVHRELAGGKKGALKTKFRFIVQAKDAKWRKYRRVDIQNAAEKAILKRYNGWRLVKDSAHVEFWIQQSGPNLIFGLRLSDRTVRHREYKKVNIEGSLRPTIAATLVYLSGVDKNDIFLDPMCGAGTILAERMIAGSYREILGGDIDESAVEAAKVNLSRLKSNAILPNIKMWDATNLPLDDESVTKIVTNPPWGRRVGSDDEVAHLYPAFIKEVERVMVSGGRCVILSGKWDEIKKYLSDRSSLLVENHIKDIEVMGYCADIFVTEKQSEK
ncbi:methyltransferase [Candidatus Dojkabacteria bacterium]|nr:methyltransferase [Candidatus Dojkabacteria bacterium]